MKYVKAHAYGNDFVLVPADAVPAGTDLGALARKICDRHRGVGGDGLIVVAPTAGGATTRLINADGSPSEVSGNGIRCVAAWIAHERRLTPGARLVLETGAGPKALTLLDVRGPEFRFVAAMGDPEELREVTIAVAGLDVRAVVLRVGNPQCVVIGPVTEARLSTIAAGLATHSFFPEGTNVELATVEAPDRVRILIWERGVGPTESSGTGACAAAVAAAAYGGADRSVDVIAPGGTQRVDWRDDGIWLTGWAEVVATGEYENQREP
jgi:diaminopimelate epimerase